MNTQQKHTSFGPPVVCVHSNLIGRYSRSLHVAKTTWMIRPQCNVLPNATPHRKEGLTTRVINHPSPLRIL